MDKKITFQIRIKAKDLWQFSMYHANRGAQGLFNLIFTGAAAIWLLTGWSESTASYRGMMLLGVLAFTVLQPLQLFIKACRQADQPAMKEPMSLEFAQEGLLVRQLDQEMRFGWDEIGLVKKMPTLIIVYMSRVRAYLIPKDVFEGREEELAGLLHKYMPGERLKRI